MPDLMSCGAWQPEELTLFLIQLRRHRAKMATARQHTLAQLQRLNGPKELNPPNHLLTSTNTSNSPLLSSVPSPVSQLGHVGLSAPLGSFNTQVGAPPAACLSVHPSFYHGLVEVATKHIAGLHYDLLLVILICIINVNSLLQKCKYVFTLFVAVLMALSVCLSVSCLSFTFTIPIQHFDFVLVYICGE